MLTSDHGYSAYSRQRSVQLYRALYAVRSAFSATAELLV